MNSENGDDDDDLAFRNVVGVRTQAVHGNAHQPHRVPKRDRRKKSLGKRLRVVARLPSLPLPSGNRPQRCGRLGHRAMAPRRARAAPYAQRARVCGVVSGCRGRKRHAADLRPGVRRR